MEARTSGRNRDATSLNAGVEVVAEYEVPAGGENKDRDVAPSAVLQVRDWTYGSSQVVSLLPSVEWFVVPLEVIDEAVDLIESEAITNYEYDPATQSMSASSVSTEASIILSVGQHVGLISAFGRIFESP